MPDLSLRGLDAAVLARIKSDARRRKTSVNRTIIELLTRHFGRSGAQYNDLDALAGTWSKAEAAEFDEAIAPFRSRAGHRGRESFVVASAMR